MRRFVAIPPLARLLGGACIESRRLISIFYSWNVLAAQCGAVGERMNRLLVSTKGTPFAASLSPPFGGSFQSKDCTILLTCKTPRGREGDCLGMGASRP